MITLVEALNYRCLQYVHRPLKPFDVLVGPNASGKSTFLDAIGFLSDLVSEGLDAALSLRSPNPEELLFQRKGDRLELAVEALIPDTQRELTSRTDLDTVRYEIAIGFDETMRRFEFKAERLLLKKAKAPEPQQQPFFPMPIKMPDSLLTNIRGQGNKIVINKVLGGNDNFYSETYGRSGSGWAPSFRMGTQRSAFGNIIADEASFPVATWFRDHLTEGVQNFVLNSRTIMRPSPPTRVAGFMPDGSNLPWVVARLRKESSARHQDWIAHLRTALPDLLDIVTIERPEDRHCYMVYEYVGGLKVPSWLVSDGTLRLTALTLPAYLPDLQGIYLIEEPENGIHPMAVSTAYDSLLSMYDAQVLLATHSPVVLNEADLSDVLCFAKDEGGATDIVQGSEHPALRQWQGGVDPGTLLASGVLNQYQSGMCISGVLKTTDMTSWLRASPLGPKRVATDSPSSDMYISPWLWFRMTSKDLVVLTADKNWMAVLNGLFARHQALGIRPITTETIRHPRKDPGCANEGVTFLSNFSEQYHYGLLIFDYEGCGKERTDSPRELQEALDRQLRSNWGNRARTIVLSPELEAWVWSNSPHVDIVAGWKNRQPGLRRWLAEEGLLQDGQVKPSRPKDALEAALREVRKPRSSSLYQQIAEGVSLNRCGDASFLEFKCILENWFPASG